MAGGISRRVVVVTLRKKNEKRLFFQFQFSQILFLQNQLLKLQERHWSQGRRAPDFGPVRRTKVVDKSLYGKMDGILPPMHVS